MEVELSMKKVKGEAAAFTFLNLISFVLLIIGGIVMTGSQFFYWVGRSFNYAYEFLFHRASDTKTFIVIAILVLSLVCFFYWIIHDIRKKDKLYSYEIMAPVAAIICPFVTLVTVRGFTSGNMAYYDQTLVVFEVIFVAIYAITSLILWGYSFCSVVSENRARRKALKETETKVEAEPFTEKMAKASGDIKDTYSVLKIEKSIGASLEYLSMTKPKRFLIKTLRFFQSIPQKIWAGIKSIPHHIVNLFRAIGRYFYSLYEALRFGNIKVKLSAVIFGFGCFSYHQIWRGVLLLLYELAFICYMVFFGGQFLVKLGTLGTVETTTDELGFKVVGDNSFNIMLYSVMTLVIILLTVVVWTMSIKLAYDSQKNYAIAKRLKTAKDDVNGFLNDNFHYTLLSIPTVLLVLFTVIPLIFMILVGFTNYNAEHMPPNRLFTWVGFDNFNTLLSGQGIGGDLANFSYAFWRILLWTFIWAIIATFSTFFLGMVLALMINKKGIKLKKFWRTALVVVIAVPQFISLLLMSKMLTNDGIINVVLETIFHLKSPAVEWLMHPTEAKIAIILVNLWIGIPYTVLSATGILMNIPADLYEASRIDGANAFKMFTKITLPYTMFVMGPSLITSFTGNLNNFNIIFLLTGGTVGFGDPRLVSAKAGDTDLLITWLYKLTVNENYYDIGSVIGIMLFIIIAFFSLVVYSRIGSNKNEEDFQ